VALLDQGRMHFQGTPTEFAHSTDAVVASFRDSAAALGTALASLRGGGTLQVED
jgi:phospholipid/cholesterol/gamma-HCH transport system ATP-binding protein